MLDSEIAFVRALPLLRSSHNLALEILGLEEPRQSKENNKLAFHMAFVEAARTLGYHIRKPASIDTHGAQNDA